MHPDSRPLQGIAVLGGTFDPVHIGHLRSALEVRETLGVERVKLVPSCNPPHRPEPESAAHRLNMLRLACADACGIEVDDREVERGGKSYTIDTLKSLRSELGADMPLTLVLGSDAVALLDQWRDWRCLFDHAHLAILSRPLAGSEPGEELATFLAERLVDDPLCLHSRPNGMICRLTLTQLEISSSKVRTMFNEGKPVDYIVPSEVIRYVRDNGLYGTASK